MGFLSFLLMSTIAILSWSQRMNWSNLAANLMSSCSCQKKEKVLPQAPKEKNWLHLAESLSLEERELIKAQNLWVSKLHMLFRKITGKCDATAWCMCHSQITKNIPLIWIRQECNNFRFKVIFTTYLQSFCQNLSTTVSNIIGTQVQRSQSRVCCSRISRINT